MKTEKIRTTLESVASHYPLGLRESQYQDIDRIEFNIRLVLKTVDAVPGEINVCDVGGGVGLFSAGCAALGFERVILVDDFGDGVLERYEDVLDIHRGYGVEIRKRDVTKNGIGKLEDTLDAVTSFDMIEHLHQSPKNVFRTLLKNMRPGGAFVLGTPNCVNLRKRITVPFGYGKWSSMSEWYESELFRGHVREPDVEDLRYIADDLDLEDTRIYGRNWGGRGSQNRVVKLLTTVADKFLRYKPSLCKNIYLAGRIPT